MSLLDDGGKTVYERIGHLHGVLAVPDQEQLAELVLDLRGLEWVDKHNDAGGYYAVDPDRQAQASRAARRWISDSGYIARDQIGHPR